MSYIFLCTEQITFHRHGRSARTDSLGAGQMESLLKEKAQAGNQRASDIKRSMDRWKNVPV